jgi:hypothetical protein
MKSITMKIGTGLFAIIIAMGVMGADQAFAASAHGGAEMSLKASFGQWIGQWTNSWRNWYTAQPVIKDTDPDAGPVGTTVTLTGKRFTDDSIVHFGTGIIKDVTVADGGDSLSFVVPEALDRYCLTQRFCDDAGIDVEADEYRITVQNGYRFSNAVTFEVTDNDGDDEPSDDGPLTITSIDGPTALELEAEGTWTVNVGHEDEGSLKYSVKWGDEGNILMRLFARDEEIQSSATFTHTYSEAGTYQPEFTVRDSAGNTVAKLGKKVVVGDSSEVPRITSVTPRTAAVGAEVTITGSGFDDESTVSIGSRRADDVTVEHGTTITFTVPEMDAGVHPISVSDNDGTSNEIDLTVIAEEKGTLSINGIEAPTRLAVGEIGTWTVDAATNLSGPLKYSVDWGTSAMKARGLRVLDTVTQASATFTHAYDAEGTFKPKFTVTDEQGNTESVGASVVVTAD